MPEFLRICVEEATLFVLLACVRLIEATAGFFACIGFLPIYLYITIGGYDFDEGSPRPVIK